LNSLWLYTAAHPDVLARANRELTTVIGEDRSPTFDDFEKLPYISAITKEMLRLRPVTAFLVTRSTTGDVVYKDHFIPKGTTVAFSQNAMHHDDCYEDSDEFKPERYLGSNVRIGRSLTNADPRERVNYAFGTGRRLCPGVHIAENSLFIVAAKVLWAFDIKPPLDDNGDEIPLDTTHEAYEKSAIVVPKPFKLRFIPRNPHREKVIREEWAKAEAEGYWLGDIKVDKDGMLSKN
jgi:cytochrome P450